MSSGNFKDDEKIKKLRQRLYSRGKGPEPREKYQLTDEDALEHTEAPRTWERPPASKKESDVPPQKATAAPTPPPPPIEPVYHRKRYRTYAVLAGLVFFVLSIAISSLLFLWGGNTISGDNIAIDLSGPFTVGGGEAIPLQVGVTNQNTVAIESATLIVNYPPGTQSVEEEGKEIFVERLSLETIDPGETLNIPVRAVVFGEENEEKTITAEIEYRVSGSNSTFAKQADPLRFKISSSPVVLSVKSLHKVSSGQESNVVLTVSSNSPNPLTNIIVRAEYPTGFDYTTSDPLPISGQNVWRIDELNPEEETEIEITGIVVGQETDEYAMHFSVGVPNDQDPRSLASVFSSATTDFLIEQPFIDVVLTVNDNDTGTVAVNPGGRVNVNISVGNTTSDTIYDSQVELALSGNALSDYEVMSGSGFYDSINNTVFWDGASVSGLQEIPPGGRVSLVATLQPSPDVDSTPQLAFDVDARARRVTEDNVTEELIGTASAVAKVSSITMLLAEVGRDTSTFTDIGPVPPVAEEETTYTVTLFVQNGTNDVNDARVTAPLPAYVRWRDVTAGTGSVTFNETSRILTWDIGSIDANQSKLASFQIGFLPSVSLIGTTPTLMGEQQFRASDSFTGAVVRNRSGAVTTRLSEEAGYSNYSGEVQQKQ